MFATCVAKNIKNAPRGHKIWQYLNADGNAEQYHKYKGLENFESFFVGVYLAIYHERYLSNDVLVKVMLQYGLWLLIASQWAIYLHHRREPNDFTSTTMWVELHSIFLLTHFVDFGQFS